jgi:hypothetical protein
MRTHHVSPNPPAPNFATKVHCAVALKHRKVLPGLGVMLTTMFSAMKSPAICVGPCWADCFLIDLGDLSEC